MKKVLLVICLFLMNVSIAFGAATALDSADDYKVWARGIEEVYTYNLATSIAIADGTVVYKIPARNTAGRIKKVYIKTASDDLDVWLSGSDGAANDDTNTYIYFNADLGYSPPISTPEPYWNTDTPKTEHLYLSLDNLSATDTGTAGIIKIIYVRY